MLSTEEAAEKFHLNVQLQPICCEKQITRLVSHDVPVYSLCQTTEESPG